MEDWKRIEIQIDMKTETKAKKVLSKLRLRSMLKSMAKEGLITGYEVTRWSVDESMGIGETVLEWTEEERNEMIAGKTYEEILKMNPSLSKEYRDWHETLSPIDKSKAKKLVLQKMVMRRNEVS